LEYLSEPPLFEEESNKNFKSLVSKYYDFKIVLIEKRGVGIFALSFSTLY